MQFNEKFQKYIIKRRESIPKRICQIAYLTSYPHFSCQGFF